MRDYGVPKGIFAPFAILFLGTVFFWTDGDDFITVLLALTMFFSSAGTPGYLNFGEEE